MSSTWNGVGGVKVTDVGPNGSTLQTTQYGYVNSSGVADPFWRLMSVTDPTGNNTVWNTYPSGTSPDTMNSSFTFNSGASIQNTTETTDALGRIVNVQTAQSPTSTYYDTTTTQYGWSGNYRTVVTSQPCSTTSGGTCASTHTDSYDPLGRLYKAVTNSNETVMNTFTQNDVLRVLGPAPSGEKVKEVQTQYDGLGRLISSCKISSSSPPVSGSVSCGQNTNTSAVGVLTTTSYTSATGIQTVSRVRGAQTRTKTYDGLGRVTVRTMPEGGTWHYYYDSSYSSCPSGYTGAPGQLEASVDSDGNVLCYQYDSLNRIKAINANGTACRGFWYDSSETPPGITIANGAGRMIEAYTWGCGETAAITDEWFSYDKDGNQTDIWELTPHSTQYYHSTATFNGNNSVATVNLASPALYGVTYGIDGEGRWNTLSDGQTIVNATTYNAAGQPTAIGLGAGTDSDTYTYDSNTGRIVNWVFTVNSLSELGAPICGDGWCTLNWNANGTLKQFGITDGFNSGGSQTCAFNSSIVAGTGYDDLGRLVGSSCTPPGGVSGSLWNQTYSYDEYDNLTKSSSGFVGWNPGYSASTNHYTCTGCTYDSDGNVTYDGTTAYAWDPFAKMLSLNGSGTNCSTGGECLIYDAFGRVVEFDEGSGSAEIWYTQLGKNVYMNGATIGLANWPAPGGGTAQIVGNLAATNFLHKDWLGNARVTSSITSSSVLSDVAYAPYGEVYDIFGSTSEEHQMFTGDTQDIWTGMWDTPNRELQGSQQGRWLSPDPAGKGWNQYAYSINPNSFIDSLGLLTTDPPPVQAPGNPAPPTVTTCYDLPGGCQGGGTGGNGGSGGSNAGGGGGGNGKGNNKNSCTGLNPPPPCANAANNGQPQQTKQQCINSYLQNNYGNFMANTGVPSFSAISIFTNTMSWLQGEGLSILAKGVVSGAPMAYGKILTTTGSNMAAYPGTAAAGADIAEAGAFWTTTGATMGAAILFVGVEGSVFATAADAYARWTCRNVP
jgi:RHS repeat-associated protein